MATLTSYKDRQPYLFQQRYKDSYWIGWANALLEKLSGRGFLPLLHLTMGVIPSHSVWIDKPAGYREAVEIHHPTIESLKYRFVDENDRLRLIDSSRAEDPAITTPTEILNVSSTGLDVNVGVKDEDDLKSWLFVVTAGTAAGKNLIIGSSSVSDAGGITSLSFLHPQSGFDAGSITAGYLTGPDYYVILSYVAQFAAITTIGDDLGLSGYENLIDAWFRWKIEEQASAVSKECVYWGGRVQDELNSLQAEKDGRMNKPVGRRLTGFIGRTRYR